MKVIRDLTLADLEQDTVLTIGAFDGLHLGHQELIARLTKSAMESKRLSGVVTFDPLPRSLFARDNTPFVCLTTIDDKVELLQSWGVDLLVIVPFTWEVANTSARDFVQPLCDRLRMVELWVGWNFALGRGREGDVGHLQRLGAEMGFTLHVVEPVSDGSAVVSSTQIRSLLNAGRIREASEMLGRLYRLRGMVTPGSSEEQRTGVATARVQLLDACTVPASGVYALYLTASGRAHRAVGNIGFAPAGSASVSGVDVHLLDPSENLEGETVRLQFVERVRDERRFASVDALKRQIRRDIARAEEILQ